MGTALLNAAHVGRQPWCCCFTCCRGDLDWRIAVGSGERGAACLVAGGHNHWRTKGESCLLQCVTPTLSPHLQQVSHTVRMTDMWHAWTYRRCHTHVTHPSQILCLSHLSDLIAASHCWHSPYCCVAAGCATRLSHGNRQRA